MPVRPAPATEIPKDSAVVRFFIAPITFVSFIISLALIDSHNSSLRASLRTTPPTTFLGRLLYRKTPQPYAYVKPPHSKESDKEKIKRDGEPWHWNTNQRKMMRMEVSDAFEIRKRVVCALGLAGILFSIALLLAANRVIHLWINWAEIGTTGPVHINQPTVIMYEAFKQPTG